MNMQAIQKAAEDKIDLITNTSIEVLNLIAKAAWNEAIEAAAKRSEQLDSWFPVNEIRKLKK